ncbi:MAG TPA: F0F1 ATP synthase subunit beta, partial [Clostridiales bacterium]|nr:F0F1 ATP synthase subunit beta [Clostridiales bacterium]
MAEGKIVQIIGPVIDCAFDEHELPLIKTEVRIQADGRVVSAEVMQQRGEGIARCVSFEATEGLARGMKV